MPAAKDKEKATVIASSKQQKPSWLWIRNGRGEPSVSVTLLTISFLTTTLSYVGSMFEHIGPITLRPFDVAACSTYFIPLLTLYFGRKWTDAKFSGNVNGGAEK